MLPLKCKNISHIANYSPPNPQSLWLWLYPRSLQPAKSPLVPYLEIISCWRQKVISWCAYICAFARTCAHTHRDSPVGVSPPSRLIPVCSYTSVQGNQVNLYPRLIKYTFCSITWGRKECLQRDYYYNPIIATTILISVNNDGTNNLYLLSISRKNYSFLKSCTRILFIYLIYKLCI